MPNKAKNKHGNPSLISEMIYNIMNISHRRHYYTQCFCEMVSRREEFLEKKKCTFTQTKTNQNKSWHNTKTPALGLLKELCKNIEIGPVTHQNCETWNCTKNLLHDYLERSPNCVYIPNIYGNN